VHDTLLLYKDRLLAIFPSSWAIVAGVLFLLTDERIDALAMGLVLLCFFSVRFVFVCKYGNQWPAQFLFRAPGQ
jgi:hypothetical protein